MPSANDLRRGAVVKVDGELYVVVNYFHGKYGRRGAYVKLKLRNLEKGGVVEKTFSPDDYLEDVEIDVRNANFSYRDGDNFVFLDNETYEQIFVPSDVVGEVEKFLKEGMDVNILLYEGNPVAVEPPLTVELEVVETDAGLKGDTVSGGSKPAKLETGLVVKVPLFVQIGDVVKVDTRDGSYVERV